jgi:hypothetical protein
MAGRRGRWGWRGWVVGGTVAAVGLVVGSAVFQPWKLVVDDVVSEAAPAELVALDSPGPSGPPASTARAGGGGPAPTARAGSGGPVPTTGAGGGSSVPTAGAGIGGPPGTAARAGSGGPATPGRAGAGGTGAPGGVARVLVSGEFISHEHGTTGRARVVALADGRRVLRIDDLDTSNGPDLRVWLSDAPVVAGPGGWRVFDDGEHVELGRLKGNKGSQNYPVPASVDLGRLASLTIWCDRFNVSFGAAALTA